jgi:hypothetical protein
MHIMAPEFFFSAYFINPSIMSVSEYILLGGERGSLVG